MKVGQGEGWDEEKGRFFPNGDIECCQCVMSHSKMEEGAWEQCTGARSPESNRYCRECEELHGEAALKRKEDK